MDLQWKKESLLCEVSEVPRSSTATNDARTKFDSDYDRIIFSSPFRRLQDKAQVFPLEKSDFVRTRLTHSMEVSSIARSIGISVERELINNELLDESDRGKIPIILASAGLAHDLGNPPFGHYGEETIKKVFRDMFRKNDKEKISGDIISEEQSETIKLSQVQRADLENFDGNCQTIRLLTRLQSLNDGCGLHLTYATLATLMKYPMDSLKGNVDKNSNDNIAYKKFGYFTSERDICQKILKEVKTYKEDGVAVRHPLAFLLEAADDIAYSAADLEDGFKKKVITFEDIEKVFCSQQNILEKLKSYRENNYFRSDEKAIQQFRIYLQGEMINAVTEKFISEQEKLLTGQYKNDILLDSSAKEIRQSLKRLANKYILNNNYIHKTELAGESILTFLLNFFIDALANEKVVDSFIVSEDKVYEKALDPREKRVYNLISIDYRNVFEKEVQKILSESEENSYSQQEVRKQILYYTYILITDFISCMTDNYSLELYRKLKGISIY